MRRPKKNSSEENAAEVAENAKDAPQSVPAENAKNGVPAGGENPTANAKNVSENAESVPENGIPADGDSDESAPENGAPEESVPAENAEAAKLADDLARVTAELLRAKEAYLRSVAEFDNYRRRTNEEKPKLANYAKGELAKDIFPVLDNFVLGLSAAEKQHPEAKSITEGFAMIAAQLRNALAQHNVTEINPLGQPFNPNEHESLTSQPSADVPEDCVLFVHRVGYKIGDRLLRPASVVISSGKPE